MIVEGILNGVFAIVEALLRLLPDISWNLDTTAFNVFLDILEMVCYLLPMPTIVTIVTLVIGLVTFRIIISLIRTIWELLPLA